MPVYFRVTNLRYTCAVRVEYTHFAIRSRLRNISPHRVTLHTATHPLPSPSPKGLTHGALLHCTQGHAKCALLREAAFAHAACVFVKKNMRPSGSLSAKEITHTYRHRVESILWQYFKILSSPASVVLGALWLRKGGGVTPKTTQFVCMHEQKRLI